MVDANTFKLLADPSRLRIIEVLQGGARTVMEIVDRVEVHQSGVSRHLGILQSAGFVQVQPDGPRRIYSLRPEPFQELDQWCMRYRRLWESRLDKFGAALAKKRRFGANRTGKKL